MKTFIAKYYKSLLWSNNNFCVAVVSLTKKTALNLILKKYSATQAYQWDIISIDDSVEGIIDFIHNDNNCNCFANPQDGMLN